MTREFINHTKTLQQEELESSLEIVSDFFGEKWIKRQEKAYKTENSPHAPSNKFHPISKWIIDHKKNMAEKKPPLHGNTVKLERLSHYIKCLKEVAGFYNFRNKLKDKKTFLPTLFELQIAAYYVEEGYKIDFIDENESGDESPEFIVTDQAGAKIAIECKSINQQPPYLEKLENIITNAFAYEQKKQKSKGAFYSLIIDAKSDINLYDLQAIIKETTGKEGEKIAEDEDIATKKLNYKKLKNKEIFYSAIYNGGNETIHSPEYFRNLQKPITQYTTISCIHQIGSNAYKEITSIHLNTTYSRNIRNSIKNRLKKAKGQISKSEGGIYINVPCHIFKPSHEGLFESIKKDIKTKLTSEQNNNIRFISLVTSPFDYSELDRITLHEMVTFENPRPYSCDNTALSP